MKILVVDDEKDIQLLFQQRFRKEIRNNEYQFVFTFSGEDALKYLNENSHDETRYQDKNAVKPAHHAEITNATVEHFIEYLKQGLSIDQSQVKNWLGQYCSDNKTYEDLLLEQDIADYDELSGIATDSSLVQSPYSHFLFSYQSQGALLFVNGDRYEVSRPFAETICEDDLINFSQLEKIMNAEDRDTLLTLFKQGAIITS